MHDISHSEVIRHIRGDHLQPITDENSTLQPSEKQNQHLQKAQLSWKILIHVMILFVYQFPIFLFYEEFTKDILE